MAPVAPLPNMKTASSSWASLSIRERIQAMNKTLDLVEEKQRSTTPNSGLLLRFSTSEETFPSSSTDVKAEEHQLTSSSNSRIQTSAHSSSLSVASRSSVVDIWRSREAVSPRIDSTKHSSPEGGPRLRPPILPVSSKSRLSDGGEKKGSNNSSVNVPLLLKNQGHSSATGNIGIVRNPSPTMPSNETSQTQQASDFTIVPAVETRSPANSIKRSRLTALWERTGASNSVVGAKQRLGIVDSSPQGLSGVTRGISTSSSCTPHSTAQSKSTEPRLASRAGTVSPADTILSTGTADTKRSTVTDIWELRCRMNAPEAGKGQDGNRPSNVPPPSSSQDTKRLSRASMPMAACKSRGDSSLSSSVARGVPFPPRPLGEAALDETRTNKSGYMSATHDHGEATSRSGATQESYESSRITIPVESRGNISKCWQLKASDLLPDASMPRARKKTDQLSSSTGEVNQSPRTTDLQVRPSRTISSTLASNQVSVRTGAGSVSNVPKRGSVADRWKSVAGATRQNDDLEDESTVTSLTHGFEKITGRWIHRTNSTSEKTRMTNAPPEAISTAVVDPSRSHIISAIDDKPSSSNSVTSRWNEVLKTVVCQGDDSVSKSPQWSMRNQHKLLSSSPQRGDKAAHEITDFSDRLDKSCPTVTSTTPYAEGGKRKHAQASPTLRSNYRKVANHWLKVTTEAKVSDVAREKKSQLNQQTTKSEMEKGQRRVTDICSSLTKPPSPGVPKSLKSRRFLDATVPNDKQCGAPKSAGNGGDSSCGCDGVLKEQPDRRQHFATQLLDETKPNYVKTVTVSSPDAVEVIQRGDFGGEISRCVLADALSNDSLVPAADEKATSTHSTTDEQVKGATSDEADSDESKQKPSKIIKSWNVRVYQTEQLPSSPRFSRQYLLSTKQRHVSLDHPSAPPAVVTTSNSSAFNAWNTPPLTDDVIGKGSEKVESRASDKHKRDLVSLGRKHIVQGLVSTSCPERKSDFTGSTSLAHLGKDVSFDVVQSTSSDDSVSLVLGSPSRNGSAVEESSVSASKQSDHARVPNPVLESRKANDSAVSSIGVSHTRRKVVPARKHLPAPIIRRKKIVREKAFTQAVANNLSDIAEGRSEDSHISGPLSPRTKELNSKKRGLLAQRRKLKLGVKDGAVTDSSHYSTAEEDSDSLPAGRRAQSAAQEQRRETVANGTERLLKAHAGQRMSVMTQKGKRADPSLPRSPVSDVDFSFLTDTNSVNSGMTSILSAGSLSNRAEKLLAGRKREQRKTTGHYSSLTEKRQPSPSVSAAERTLELPEYPARQKPQVSQAAALESGCAATAERPRLETRYNTSSRFLDAAQMDTNSDREDRNVARTRHQGSAEQIRTVESAESSYQSADSASDESDARQRKRQPRTSRHWKAPRKPLVQQPSVASEQFLAENAASFTAFSTAYKRFSLRDIASDLAGEIKLLGIDTTSFASTVNSKIALCVNETKKAKSCHEYLGFGDEDVAIEVEFMEEELDEDASNSIEDDDYDDSTLEEPTNILTGNRSICVPLGYQGERVS